MMMERVHPPTYHLRREITERVLAIDHVPEVFRVLNKVLRVGVQRHEQRVSTIVHVKVLTCHLLPEPHVLLKPWRVLCILDNALD